MSLAFHFAARSDVGMVRTNNEDSGYAGPHLLAMADGMGGHAGGEVASSTVVGALVSLDGEALSAAEAPERLLEAIHSGNAELGRRIAEEPLLGGMGTTLIALLRAHDKIALAHIGDSRAFLVREGRVTQVTKDHSFVQSLVDEGRITAEEAMTHPQRSLVTRVLTGSQDDEPDIVVRQAQHGDRYVIASDGLTDYVARDTIDEVILTTTSPAACAERLVELAMRSGAPDNVTIVVGDVVDLVVGPVPSDQPQVVGAAALSGKGTRPLPVTPAEKAAALTKEATRPEGSGGGEDGGEDDLTLAEEGPRSLPVRIARGFGILLAVAVVVGGISYAAWVWVQRQYWVGTDRGQVAVYRGVDQKLGPISLSQMETQTTIDVTDLPEHYQESLSAGIQVEDRAAADRLVTSLRVQAGACLWARAHDLPCRTVPDTWTPPSPSPSPSSSPTGPSPSPAGASPTSAVLA